MDNSNNNKEQDLKIDYLSALPYETIQHIFSFLGYKEICILSQTSTDLYNQTSFRWSSLITEDFGDSIETLSRKYDYSIESHNKLYSFLYNRITRIAGESYLPMKSIWNRLEKWIVDNKQESYLLKSFKKPITEQQSALFDNDGVFMANLTKSKRHKPSLSSRTDTLPPAPTPILFPRDYIASILLYNGQSHTTPYGLFGTFEAYDFMTNIVLLPFEISSTLHQQKYFHYGDNFQNVWPVAYSFSTERCYYLILADPGYRGIVAGNVVLSCGTSVPQVVANTFREFMDQHVAKLETKVYTLRDNIISRYPEYSTYITQVKTNGIWVKGSAVYVPEERAQNYSFFYRVTIWMDKDEDESCSAQLLTRHWDIVTPTTTHVVDGDGVIGLLPKIRPGVKFEYCSRCEVDSPTGSSMSGYFNFMPLNSPLPSVFSVVIPPFQLTTEQH